MSSFADPRFLLPAPPRSASVLPGAEAWLPPLMRAGLDTTGTPPLDLVITGPQLSAGETEGVPSVIVEGEAALNGYTSRRYVVFGSRDSPRLLVPRDRGNVMSYALSAWSAPRTGARALRRRLVLVVPRLAVRLARWPQVTIATRDTGPPYVVAAALQQLGVETPVDWLLICGQSDDLGRAAFVVFPQSASRPRWIVKFVRVPGYPDPIERDERALAAVAGAGGVTAAHAPRFLGRLDVSGLAASIETAAAGRRLSAILTAAGPRAAKMRAVDAVAEWIVRVGLETRHDGASRRGGATPQGSPRLLANRPRRTPERSRRPAGCSAAQRPRHLEHRQRRRRRFHRRRLGERQSVRPSALGSVVLPCRCAPPARRRESGRQRCFCASLSRRGAGIGRALSVDPHRGRSTRNPGAGSGEARDALLAPPRTLPRGAKRRPRPGRPGRGNHEDRCNLVPARVALRPRARQRLAKLGRRRRRP